MKSKKTYAAFLSAAIAVSNCAYASNPDPDSLSCGDALGSMLGAPAATARKHPDASDANAQNERFMRLWRDAHAKVRHHITDTRSKTCCSASAIADYVRRWLPQGPTYCCCDCYPYPTTEAHPAKYSREDVVAIITRCIVDPEGQRGKTEVDDAVNSVATMFAIKHDPKFANWKPPANQRQYWFVCLRDNSIYLTSRYPQMGFQNPEDCERVRGVDWSPCGTQTVASRVDVCRALQHAPKPSGAEAFPLRATLEALIARKLPQRSKISYMVPDASCPSKYVTGSCSLDEAARTIATFLCDPREQVPLDRLVPAAAFAFAPTELPDDNRPTQYLLPACAHPTGCADLLHSLPFFEMPDAPALPSASKHRTSENVPFEVADEALNTVLLWNSFANHCPDSDVDERRRLLKDRLTGDLASAQDAYTLRIPNDADENCYSLCKCTKSEAITTLVSCFVRSASSPLPDKDHVIRAVAFVVAWLANMPTQHTHSPLGSSVNTPHLLPSGRTLTLKSHSDCFATFKSMTDAFSRPDSSLLLRHPSFAWVDTAAPLIRWCATHDVDSANERLVDVLSRCLVTPEFRQNYFRCVQRLPESRHLQNALSLSKTPHYSYLSHHTVASILARKLPPSLTYHYLLPDPHHSSSFVLRSCSADGALQTITTLLSKPLTNFEPSQISDAAAFMLAFTHHISPDEPPESWCMPFPAGHESYRNYLLSTDYSKLPDCPDATAFRLPGLF